MKVVAARSVASELESEIETLLLSPSQFAYLGRLSKKINPQMAEAFGRAEAIRTLLDRLEESGIDLNDAKSEQELARLAAVELRRRRRC